MTTTVTYAYDLAISAVSYDAMFVNELVVSLATRLRSAPVWTAVVAPSSLSGDVSRVALVLAQRLWGHDEATSVEAESLRERARREPKSVVVVVLDDAALPSWMDALPRCELAGAGMAGVVQFVLEAIVNAGGSVKPIAVVGSTSESTEPARSPDGPVPFLGQPRAHGALRRELDAISAELEPMIEAEGEQAGDQGGIFELHTQPNRIVARLADVGVTFSWVAGRQGTVADGRLMVIEWSGVAARNGVGALKTARPVRECLYSAEARGVDDWCWRADVPNGRASSTANLVGEWLACATMRCDRRASVL